MDRREWLCGSAAVVGAALVPLSAWARAATLGAAGGPPVAKVKPVIDTYFGETLVDRYRWMENDEDPDWRPYLKAENDYARSVLDRLPGRDALLARIQTLSADTVAYSELQQAGGKLFFEQRPPKADNYKLYVKDGSGERLLIDPTAMTLPGAGHVSLDWWSASPDGRYIAYGVSKDGSEDSVLHVLDLSTGKDLPERISNTQGANPQWLDDASGFFYTQLTGAVDTPERFLDAQARFHRLGTDPTQDPIVMKRGRDPAVAYDRIQMPGVLTYRGSDHVVLQLGDVRPEGRFYVAPIADAATGRARWVEVTRFEDEVTDIDLHDGEILLLANHGTPRGRLLRTPIAAPALATAREVVPQGVQVIEGLYRAADGVYLKMMDGGLSRLRRLDETGRVHEVVLPFEGTIGQVSVDPARPGALLLLGGWLTPTGVFAVAGDKASATAMVPAAPIDTRPYATQRAFAAARDGTRIPYTLIYRNGIRRDGNATAFIQAYGSYGSAAYTPRFAARLLALVDQGAVVGFVGVRGGGEYGREWHKAGQLANKPNTWRDLIDVCEALCKLGWTSPAHLAIGGRSAGGITVGRALTERPDLFAAVIDGVGWSNPLRYVAEQNGYGEEPEWGAIGDLAGYRYLKAIDSYQAVKDGTPYPAVLLTTGVTDPRVAPFHVAKMTARLQSATSSKRPILMRVDYDAGHGIGSTRSQGDREAVDTYAFLLWQTRIATP